MVVQTDRRVLWHPRLYNRFLVGSASQVTLYEWLEESSELKHITSNHGQDASSMKCMAWSPDPSFDDLVAVGFNSGKVELMRLEGTKSALARSPSQSWTRPTTPLTVKNSRACNALAFCTADPNYLAAGLDKVRGDFSLIVWDITSATASLSIKVNNQDNSNAQVTFNTVLPGTSSRPEPIIPRAEGISSKGVLQQHAPAEVVSSVAFVPNSTTIVLAGISHRWLRIFDLRTPVPSVKSTAIKVQGIATDSLDPTRFGTFGDGNVMIWDSRRMTQPLVTFTHNDASGDGSRYRGTASAVIHMEFSTSRRGTLATLERDSSHVRFWDLQSFDLVDRSPERSHSRDSTQSSRATRLSWANPSNILPWSASLQSGQISAPATPMEDQRAQHHVVLSDTRRTKYFSKPISSFALVPSVKDAPLTSNVMVVTKEGDLELYAVHDTPTHTPWSARGDFALGIRKSYVIMPGFHETESPPEPWELTAQSYPQSTPRSVQRPPLHDEMPLRGRSGAPAAATFGRGDEDGFPALGGPARNAGNTTSTRPGSRALSPMAWRSKYFDHAAVSKRVPIPSPAPDQGGKSKHRSQSRKNRDSSPVWGHGDNSVRHGVETDISMTMRKRVVRGYGLVNPVHNSAVAMEIIPDPVLSQTWLWIDHTQNLLAVHSSLLDGYSFSYHGILGIWEGFRPSKPHPSAPHPTPRLPQRSLLLETPQTPLSNLISESQQPRSRSRQTEKRRPQAMSDGSSEEFSSVVATLLSESDSERSTWKPAVPTSKPAQRRFALDLCGWSLAEEDLASAVKRWEKEHRYSQAACWLVFTRKYKAAVDLLMRSKDESHHMMSGMLAALNPSSGSGLKNAELRDHCERLIIRLQDPYLRAMLTHLTINEDWTEVLQEESLPLRERLAIAFQFLSDKELTTYLRRIVDRGAHSGDIETLIVAGLTPQGMDILQAYLDSSGDIQTVALLASLNPARSRDKRVGRWLDTYRDLLDQWKLFHYRCQLDIDRGRILSEAIQQGELMPFKWTKPQIILRCNFCNKPLTPPWPDSAKATSCYHCGRSLPRCSICLMTLNIVQDPVRNAELNHSQPKDTIDEALVFCQTCRHGGHSSHILDWFFGDDGLPSHEVCPVASCECRCADGM